MIKANNPTIKSWIKVSPDSDFPIQNIPFGVFKKQNNKPCVATRIGDTAIDLNAMLQLNYFEGIELNNSVFDQENLNSFLKLNKKIWRAVRDRISEVFDEKFEMIESHKSLLLTDITEVEMMMPVQVGDYTDFYSSRQHAYNVGCMFRDPNNALLPNWLHIPVGYHGRASSIVLSGTDIHRPKGQQLLMDTTTPIFGPCKLMDFELEMAFVTGQGKKLGESITTAEAEDFIFGMCIFNDWSARDIQKWEYVPLGPFLGKNFGSSISPWIVSLDALSPFRVAGETQEPKPLSYLEFEGNKNIDIKLEVQLSSKNFAPHTISRSNYKYMYWNMNQQLAHHTINGCNINAGDMMASGTISGNTPEAYGSMLELSWKGTKPIQMPDGTVRKFIHDNDTVIMKAHCENDQYRIGFGEVKTKILPAKL
ncbi:fumarylacetoacetase [Flavobacteriales bacterium]|nr:fumarylacetoacetase [Flavobacteriales bacterium]MDB2653177.1 fumarylacetoacetase [Flavobacteriales bacterium]